MAYLVLVLTEEAVARFRSNVSHRSAKECWPWLGDLSGSGYGRISIDGRQWVASRVAWQIQHGRTPDGVVCHSCDNPTCVNPAHLFLGTMSDNMTDASRKGRVRGQAQTHCVNGHEFNARNTYLRPGTLTGRQCRRCNAQAAKRYSERAAA